VKFHSLILPLGLTAFMALSANSLMADLVIFELSTDVVAAPGVSLGAELDSVDDPDDPNSASTATLAGITFVATATTNFGDGTAIFNAAGGGTGVNSGGGGGSIGDSASAIDIGEELTLTLNFDPTLFDVALEGVDFGNINDAADSATLAIAGGVATVFTADLDLTATPLSLSSGDTLVFSNTSVSADGTVFPDFDPNFDVEGITLHIKSLAIPEPTSFALLGLGSLALLGRRKRSI